MSGFLSESPSAFFSFILISLDMNIDKYLPSYFSGSSGSSSSEESPEASPEGSPEDGAGSPPDSSEPTPGDPSESDRGLTERFRETASALMDDLFNTGGPDRPSNEQPTNYNPIFVAGIVILLMFGILALALPWGSTDSSDPATSEEAPQQQQENVQQRQGPAPGVEGEDPTTFYQQPNQSGNQPTPPPTSEGGAPPSQQGANQGDNIDASRANPREYAQELAEQANQGPPPGAPDQGQSDPYQSAPSGEPSKSLQQAASSNMKIETKPPGTFDPNKEGIPRDAASGRPLGSPPTPEETRKEAQYAQEQQQDQQQQTPQERLRQRYPTGGGLSEGQRFLERQRSRAQTPDQLTSVEGPFSPFVIPNGTIIPVVLESKVSNDVPGTTIMRVTRDVYDRTYRHILIPRGSEVVSTYSTTQSVGQNRVLVAANRLNLPDGRYVEFKDTRSAGPTGTAGLEDIKDRHLLSRFGAAGALAVLGAVVNASNPLSFLGAAQQDSTNVIAGGGRGFRGRFQTTLSQQINQIIGQLLQKQVDREPTLRLREGLRGLLIINEDINMKRPYYETGDDFQQQTRQYRRYMLKKKQREMTRTLRRIERMNQSRQKTRQLRRQVRQAETQPEPPSPPQQAQSEQQAGADNKYYVEKLKAQNRKGSTMIPPRRGPTDREQYIFGPNYHREPAPKGSPQRQSVPPPPEGESQLPRKVRQYRRTMRREMPQRYRDPNRPEYDRGRQNNRYSRGKQFYRPQETGAVNQRGGAPQGSGSPPPGSSGDGNSSSRKPPESAPPGATGPPSGRTAPPDTTGPRR